MCVGREEGGGVSISVFYTRHSLFSLVINNNTLCQSVPTKIKEVVLHMINGIVSNEPLSQGLTVIYIVIKSDSITTYAS